MPLTMLAFSLLLGLLIIQGVAYLPLNLLGLLRLPGWFTLTTILLIAAWCMGE